MVQEGCRQRASSMQDIAQGAVQSMVHNVVQGIVQGAVQDIVRGAVQGVPLEVLPLGAPPTLCGNGVGHRRRHSDLVAACSRRSALTLAIDSSLLRTLRSVSRGPSASALMTDATANAITATRRIDFIISLWGESGERPSHGINAKRSKSNLFCDDRGVRKNPHTIGDPASQLAQPQPPALNYEIEHGGDGRDLTFLRTPRSNSCHQSTGYCSTKSRELLSSQTFSDHGPWHQEGAPPAPCRPCEPLRSPFSSRAATPARPPHLSKARDEGKARDQVRDAVGSSPRWDQ